MTVVIEWQPCAPPHWQSASVKRLFDVVLGKMLQPVESSSDDIEVPYLKAQHVQWGGIESQELPTMFASPSEIEVLAIRKGDLLVCEGGEVGRASLVKDNLPTDCIFQNALHRVRGKNQSQVSFLLYVLRHAAEKGWFEVLCNRSTIAHFTVEKFGDMQIRYPPPDEQRAIANFLDRETARLDSLLAEKETLLTLIDEKRSALIAQAVTRGLEANAPLRDSGVTWIGKISENWPVWSLRRVVKSFIDYRGATPTKVSSGIPLITARNVKNGRVDFSLSEEFIRKNDYAAWMVRGFPEIGDVLITTEAPLGEVGQIAEPYIALAQRIILLKPNKAHMTGDFLKYYLMSVAGQGELWSRATGSTALGIKASHLRDILVVTPPLDEQYAIVSHIDRETARLDTLKRAVHQHMDIIRERRTALIAAAVTGEIDVREETIHVATE